MKNENVLWWVLAAISVFIGIGIPGWFNIPYWAILVCCIIGTIGILESVSRLK